jgi:aerobic-type carbon monoxide dehydrogenase small subunit (CoxS/CutS family)
MSSTINRQNNTNIPNVNKNLPSCISTTPTAEGLTITAINQTGQKQVFMAKQLGNLKKYQCGLCEKIVTNIQIHVRRHTNDKPYPW